ncbi:MAG: 3-phosphoshikimate 1-carboxyvinyltransferase, partial [Acidobacteriaceae bacterium]
DCIASVLALESLGVPVDVGACEINLQGVGRHGYRAPSHAIHCANSGTTARFLIGLLSGQEFVSTLTGDASLSKRPMKRLADVLSLMGAEIATSVDGIMPVAITGQPLHAAAIRLPVASAQMKTAVLLAGLFAEGVTTVREPTHSRDHTERMMAAFRFGIEPLGEISLDPLLAPDLPEEIVYPVPGDLSSAAFMIAAAALLKRRLTISGVSLNPSRTRFLEILTLMGLEVEADDVVEEWNEPRGTLAIYGDRVGATLQPFHIDGRDVPLLIDELPVLMMLALFADGESTIRGAGELRVKEADRIALVARQFEAFSADVEELEDGIIIQGKPERQLKAAPIHHGGDHRLAMAFSISSLFADGPCELSDAEVVSVSYPDFFKHLAQIAGERSVEVAA